VFLRRLGFSNFRNYSELDLEPAAGLNVFVGANAQGKSNLLEGIAMLGTGKSFRTVRDADTVRAGSDRAMLSGEAASRSGNVNLACTIERGARGTRKTYTVNAGPVRYAHYLGRIRVVTFVPADLRLAAGTPSARRAFLNIALAQTEPPYYYELARYRKALHQKNALLRGAVEWDSELLQVYERTLLAAGSEIILARARLIDELARGAAAAHARFAAGELLEVRYEPNVPFESAEPGSIAEAFEIRMRHAADAERARKTTLVGPHRDDVTLSLGGTSLAAYGSQGQQRTAVLALKVAEYTVMRERSNETPLLLLDDVLSELDETRARAFLGEIGEYEQAFVTATHVPAGLSDAAHVARVDSAHVLEWIAC
jgi:DNA replication and repair protein RecF